MSNVENMIKNVVTTWQSYYSNNGSSIDMDAFIAKAELFNQIHSSNLRVVLFSFADLSILHINQSAAEFFGSTVDAVKLQGASLLMSCFNKEQLEFANNAAISSAAFTAKANGHDILNSYTCYANWIVNSLNGVKHRALFRIFPVKLNERHMPSVGMYLIYDIKPFIRGDVWWYRSSTGISRCSYYQSEEKKLINRDILTEREKLILQQIADGKSSKEIGEALYISHHTVDNHRRKMLNKTGAIDTSSLIYISKLSGILS